MDLILPEPTRATPQLFRCRRADYHSIRCHSFAVAGYQWHDGSCRACAAICALDYSGVDLPTARRRGVSWFRWQCYSRRAHAHVL